MKNKSLLLCNNLFFMNTKTKYSQIWVETVVYTLIGLSILGMIIAVITPKINQMIDKTTLTHSLESLNSINEQIMDTMTSAGQQREIILNAKKGEYVINGLDDTFYFILKNSNYKYSQPGIIFPQGDIEVLTSNKTAGKYDVVFLLNYSSFNLTFYNEDGVKQLTSSPVEYNLLIQNKGNKQLNFEIR